MSTIGTILSLVLAVAFAAAGGTKVANVGPHEEEFPRFNLPAISVSSAVRPALESFMRPIVPLNRSSLRQIACPTAVRAHEA